MYDAGTITFAITTPWDVVFSHLMSTVLLCIVMYPVFPHGVQLPSMISQGVKTSLLNVIPLGNVNKVWFTLPPVKLLPYHI